MTRILTLLISGLATSSVAIAQETVDVGVLRDEDISVVQKLLYSKDGRTEFGGYVGWMPFDAYTTTPMAGFGVMRHLSETMGAGVSIGGGYSLKNASYKELEGPAYGVSPDAYRYLGSALAEVAWSPIYAKMNWQGNAVVHHDIYGLVGAGITVEQAMLPDNAMAFAPTLGAGIGARIFLSDKAMLKIQLRDDFLLEKRIKTEDTQGTFLKQNVGITIGYSALGARS